MMQFSDCFVIGPIPILRGFAATFRALASARVMTRGWGAVSNSNQEV
jgi:hypothetical protein